MAFGIALASYEPVGRTLGLACHRDILGRLGFQVARVVPVASHVTYKLEGIVILLVILGQVGCHLQRRVHRQIESQLSAESGVDIRLIVAPFTKLRDEDARSVVHRTALQTCERQDDGVVRLAAAERLILCSACRLVADEIGPCAAKSGRTCRLMSVHHDVVLGSLLDAVEIVVVGGLRVMVVASRNDVAHVAALHGIIAILVHQRICCFEMTLIVLCGTARLVVHHQLHAL